MGWCSGGIIAFEMAQQLKSKGQQVETLILLDTPALIPKHKTWWREMRDDRIKLLSTFADTIAAYVGESVELDRASADRRGGPVEPGAVRMPTCQCVAGNR